MEKIITKKNIVLLGVICVLLFIASYFVIQNSAKKNEKLFDIFLADLYNDQKNNIDDKLQYLSSLNNTKVSFFSDLKLTSVDNLDRYKKIDKDIILLKKALIDLDEELIKSLSTDDNFIFNEIIKVYLYNLDINNYNFSDSDIDNLNNFFIKAIDRLSNENN